MILVLSIYAYSARDAHASVHKSTCNKTERDGAAAATLAVCHCHLVASFAALRMCCCMGICLSMEGLQMHFQARIGIVDMHGVRVLDSQFASVPLIDGAGFASRVSEKGPHASQHAPC